MTVIGLSLFYADFMPFTVDASHFTVVTVVVCYLCRSEVENEDMFWVHLSVRRLY